MTVLEYTLIGIVLAEALVIALLWSLGRFSIERVRRRPKMRGVQMRSLLVLLVPTVFLVSCSSGVPSTPWPTATPVPPWQRTMTVKAFTADQIPVTVKLLVMGSATSTVGAVEEAEVAQAAIARLSVVPVLQAVTMTDFSLDSPAGIEVLLLSPVTPPKEVELAWQTDYNARLTSERVRHDVERLEKILTPSYIEYVRAQNVKTQIITAESLEGLSAQ